MPLISAITMLLGVLRLSAYKLLPLKSFNVGEGSRMVKGIDSGGGDPMTSKTKVGIIICDRYRICAGGKCFRAMRNKEGAFSSYTDTDVELVGFTTCNGCPGGNVEYAGEEMVRNGAEVIHLATGMVVGYPPCPSISTFKLFIEKRYGIKVVVGTHPIPKKYLEMHTQLGTWENSLWAPLVERIMCDDATHARYD